MIKYKRIPKAEARDLFKSGRPVYILPAEPRRMSKRDGGADGAGDFDTRADRMQLAYKNDLAFFAEQE